MASPSPQARFHVKCSIAFALLALALVSSGCGGGGVGGGGGTPVPNPIPTPVPTPVPPLGPNAIEVSVANATVPTGGIYQYQLLLTEPKPIGNSSSRPTLPGSAGPVRGFAAFSAVGPIRGVAVNDITGQAAGIAVIDASNNVTVKLTSPNISLGTNNTYPLFTMTMPVTATSGTFPANLDGANSLFVDGSGNSYTIAAITAGTLTVGGTMSITDVVPGGGLLADRTLIKILGLGFTANTKIAIEGTTIFAADTTLVGPNEVDVVICNGVIDPAALTCPHSSPVPDGTGPTFQLDGERVKATDKSKPGELVQYFSYPRTTSEAGTSANLLVQQVHPMFSRQTFRTATIPYAAVAPKFTGLALQNTSLTDASFTVELLDANGVVLSNSGPVTLRAGKKIVRDIQDWIPAVGSTTKTVRVTVSSASPALQMLGMLGDTSAGTVSPVLVTGQ